MAREVTTSLGTLLERVCDRLELPRGTRLGVKVGHRQLRADKRFARKALPKASEVDVEDAVTVNEAVSELVRPRLPEDIRKKAKFLIYPPGDRKPAKGTEHLRNAREWGDGRTRELGEHFDTYVEEAFSKLEDIWYETVEDIGEEEIFLRAVCRFFDNPKQMIPIIERHFKANGA